MKARNGFTLIELMVTVAVLGVLAATAIPAFMKYIHKAKTSEARQNVRKIYDGARSYYLDQATGPVTQMQPVAMQFPVGSVLAPPNNAGLGFCCAVSFFGGEKEKCGPNAVWWENPIWRALHFAIADPHYYRYHYQGGGFFNAIANGNLDCDMDYSWFQMRGSLNPTYADGPTGTSILYRVNELE
jgi:prepilin-type N-terminal cleavage/methylation domain-containing protein